MNKTEIIETLVTRTGLTSEEVTKTLDELLDLIIDTLDNNGVIDLGGFGVFDIEMAPERTGVDPHTGQAQLSNPRRRARFKAGAEMGGAVN